MASGMTNASPAGCGVGGGGTGRSVAVGAGGRFAFAFERQSDGVNARLSLASTSALVRGTPEHAALASACAVLIGSQLLGRNCRTYNSDLGVHTPSGLATYPDVTVVCGASARDAEDSLAVTNPILIVEIVSRSTEQYDRGAKFEHYRSLASLQQYVLVAQERRSIEVRSRGEDGNWTVTFTGEGENAELVMGLRLDVRELYDAATE